MIQIFTCFLLCCCGSTFSARQKRITYGRIVTRGELQRQYPFVLYIQIRHPRGYAFCSGSLVKKNRVLTAAHCFCIGKGRVTAIHVWAKSLYLRNGERRSGYRLARNPVDKQIGCNDLNDFALYSNVALDYALIRLYRPFHDIQPVPLFCGNVPLWQNATMIGYGYDERNANGKLRVGSGRTIPCPRGWMGDKPICMDSGGRLQSTTVGDSGGPLLINRDGRFYQVGVSSCTIQEPWGHFGFGSVQVWASVRPHCPWINAEETVPTQREKIVSTEAENTVPPKDI